MLDDKVLYKEFLEGSNDAFEKLVLSHKDNLIYFISRYTKDIYMAEDIAQDVFAYIYVYKEKYNFDYSFKTYIYTLGKNKAIDYIRKQERVNLVDVESYSEDLYSDSYLEEKIINDEERRMLIASMKKLKPDYEKVIYLVDFEGLTYEEAGKILGKNMGQTKILIHRARKALKGIIEKGADYDENR